MEELLFVCPSCAAYLIPPEEGWGMNCPHCTRRVDLIGQFAYVRAFQAYEEAAEAMDVLKESPNKMRFRRDFLERERQAFDLFLEAYTALQEAFRYELAEQQHAHGIEMAANMAHIFLPRGLISDLEAAFWSSLMFEQTARQEYHALALKLEQPHEGVGGALRRWRMTMRRKQLAQSLDEIDIKIRRLEKGLGIAYHIHAYRGKG